MVEVISVLEKVYALLGTFRVQYFWLVFLSYHPPLLIFEIVMNSIIVVKSRHRSSLTVNSSVIPVHYFFQSFLLGHFLNTSPRYSKPVNLLFFIIPLGCQHVNKLLPKHLTHNLHLPLEYDLLLFGFLLSRGWYRNCDKLPLFL